MMRFPLIFLTLAATTAAQTLESPEGGHYRVIFPDGRMARLYEKGGYTETFEIQLNIVSNTCSEYASPCTLKIPLRQRVLAYLWDQNPVSPERVGRMLQTKDGRPSPKEFSKSLTSSFFSEAFLRQMGFIRMLNPDLLPTLSCDPEDSPLFGNTTQAALTSWSFLTFFSTREFIQNIDTYRYTAMARDITLSTTENEYRIEHIGAFNTLQTVQFVTLLFEEMEFVVNHGFCRILFSPNNRENQLAELEVKYDPKNFFSLPETHRPVKVERGDIEQLVERDRFTMTIEEIINAGVEIQ